MGRLGDFRAFFLPFKSKKWSKDTLYILIHTICSLSQAKNGSPPTFIKNFQKIPIISPTPPKKNSSYRELCPGPEMRVHLVSSYRKRNFHKWQSVLVHPGASETLSIIREGSEQVIRSLDKEWQISSKPMFAPSLPPSLPRMRLFLCVRWR
jgi:hypothetical protein